MKLKKIAATLLVATLAIGTMAGCKSTGNDNTADGEKTENTGASGDITILSREDGSGTRGAFVELFGIEEEKDGEKVDMTTEDAKITNSTSVMMTTVAGDVNSLGYISLGSLNDTVTAVKIDDVEATAENVSNGTYKIARPFNIATKGEDLSEAGVDFVNFILSKEGQQVITDNGYINVGEGEAFASNNASGKLTIAGSSSVTPVMEKLVEAYNKVNANVEIEVQESDSSTGMQSTIDGLCDIGMASRALKDSETGAGLVATEIAKDGIAVIVNNDSGITDLTSDQVKQIYTGEILTWDELQ